MLEYVLVALLDPSAEFMPVYLGLGLFIAAVALIYTRVFKAKQELTKVDANLLDSQSRDSSKKDRSPQMLDGVDMSGLNRDALFKELDQNGPYPCTLQGTVEVDAFCKLRHVIVKHGYLAYLPTKQSLLQKRLKLLNKSKEYSLNIQKTQQAYNKIMQFVTHTAIDFLGIEATDYQASFREATKDPDIYKKV